MNNNILLIIEREYMLRVRKKAFLFTTILMPIVFLALMFGPTLLTEMNTSLPDSIYVVDQSGEIGDKLKKDYGLTYILLEEPIDSVKVNTTYDNILFLGKDIVDNPSEVILYTRGSGSIEEEVVVRNDLENAIEAVRFSRMGFENYDEFLKIAEANVAIKTIKIDDKGVEEHSDTMVAFIIGIVMAFVLYMFIMIYGQLVMMGIIEEKNSRVLELIVTSVKPTQLMLGKIIGVGLVAVTQVLIWLFSITLFIVFVLPSITGPELMEQVNALKEGVPFEPTYSIQLLQAMVMFTELGYIFSIFGYLLLFLIGGFLLYAGLYAIVGAAVDNPQDGSQFQLIIMVPILLSLVFASHIVMNPDTALADWLSMIPFTSPIIMMARIPSGVSPWSVIASLVLLYATVFVVIRLAAKIYRIGIFMYGKKPSISDLVKWARYK